MEEAKPRRLVLPSAVFLILIKVGKIILSIIYLQILYNTSPFTVEEIKMEMKHLFLLGVLAVGLAGCTTVSRQVDPQTGEVTTQTNTFVPLPVPIVVPRRVEPQPYYPQQPY